MQFLAILASVVAAASAVPAVLNHGVVSHGLVSHGVIAHAAIPAATTYHTQKSFLAPVGTHVSTHVQPGHTQVVSTAVHAAPAVYAGHGLGHGLVHGGYAHGGYAHGLAAPIVGGLGYGHGYGYGHGVGLAHGVKAYGHGLIH